MEVGVVLAGQRMKISEYFYYTFFISIRTEISGSFRQKLPPVFLDLGRSIVEEKGRLKLTSPPEDLSCDMRE